MKDTTNVLDREKSWEKKHNITPTVVCFYRLKLFSNIHQENDEINVLLEKP